MVFIHKCFELVNGINYDHQNNENNRCEYQDIVLILSNTLLYYIRIHNMFIEALYKLG
jgi:hypothetical protein